MFNNWGSSDGPNLPVLPFYDVEEERKIAIKKWREKIIGLEERGLSRRNIRAAQKQIFALKDAFCRGYPENIPANILMDPLKTFLKKEETKDWFCEEERAYYLLFAEKFCRAVNIKFSLLPKQLSEIFKKEGITL